MLVWRTLTRDPVRLLLSLAGIAGALVLILLIEGLSAGIYLQARAFNENSGADLVIAEKGVDSMQTSRSLVPLPLVKEIEEHAGVEEVAPIVLLPLAYDEHGHKTPIMVVGYETGGRLGRPWKLAEGRRPIRRGEAVLDLSFAERHDFAVGDRITLLGRDLEVVGLSLETGSWMNPYVFVDIRDASEGVGLKGAANYLLVGTEPGFSPRVVRDDIRDAAHPLTVLLSSQMATRQANVLKEVMGSAVNLMVGIAYVIGLLVIGLTSYAVVLDNLESYGVIKALGAGNPRLYRTVLSQVIVITSLGFVAGIFLALTGRSLIANLFPQFLIAIDPPLVVSTLAGVLAIALIASLLPVRRVARLDPASVFR